MDFWGKKINVSEKAARRQVEIYTSFPPEKRLRIAEQFAAMGVERTRQWIKEQHPEFSEREVTLEFVRLEYYETGGMKEEHWQHFRRILEEEIRQEWIQRFRAMMKALSWTYEDVARYGRFKNAAVAKSTLSRGLPGFAKLAVMVFEQR